MLDNGNTMDNTLQIFLFRFILHILIHFYILFVQPQINKVGSGKVLLNVFKEVLLRLHLFDHKYRKAIMLWNITILNNSFLFEYVLKCVLFWWWQRCIFSIVFGVTWSFRTGAAPANFEGRCWGGARSLTRGAAQFLYIYIYIYIYITVYIYMLMSQTWKYFCFKPWRRANGYYISNVKILHKRYVGERLNLSKLEKVKVKTE